MMAGILEELSLSDDLWINYIKPSIWARLFSKYKGGGLGLVLDEQYHDPHGGGYDWEEIDHVKLFDRFYRLKEYADELASRGNKVEFLPAFCSFSIDFIDIEQATLCRLEL